MRVGWHVKVDETGGFKACLVRSENAVEEVIGLQIQRVTRGTIRGVAIALPAISDCENHDFILAVLDAAWEAGLRPTGYVHEPAPAATAEGNGDGGAVARPLRNNAGEIDALRAHLADMRAIAFGRLQRDEPGHAGGGGPGGAGGGGRWRAAGPNI